MSDKAGTEKGARRNDAAGTEARLSRWTLSVILAVSVFAAIIAVNIAAPYLFAGATLEGAVAEQLRATSGLAFQARISGRFDLLPRPHLVFYEAKVTDPSGLIEVSAEEIDGDVRLLPLIVGRIELSSVTLADPKMTIDLDRKPVEAESFIGRAMRAGKSNSNQPLGIVTFVNGTTTVKSRTLRHPIELSDVNMTLDWRDLDSPATLTGSLAMRKTSADVAAWIASPSSLMRGAHSAVTLKFHSAPLDVSATGDVTSGATTSFSGHISASSNSPAAVLGIADKPAALIAPFANLSVSAYASMGINTDNEMSVDLQSLSLRADGNAYEGSLSFQNGARPALSGTLATEQLGLAPFLSRLPKLHDQNGGWSSARLVGTEPPPFDLDLRISASHMRLAPFTIDDAALAVMTRGDRTEVALVEGKAYGGTAKGRVSVGISNEDVSVRSSGSLTGADASALSWDGFGRQLIAGTFSASANVETNGESIAALMHNLQGWTKCSATDGEIVGIDFGRALRAHQNRDMVDGLKALRGGRTAFRSLVLGSRVADGIATVDEGTVTSSTASISLSGAANLGSRELDLRLLATLPGPSTPSAAMPLALGVRGPFDKATLQPDAATDRK